MTTSILVIHIILAAAMIGIILLQRNEGGALGMGGGGGMGGLMTSRGSANLLTRMTAILATSFFVTSLALALLFKGAHKPQSILDDDIREAQTSSSPVDVPTSTDQKAESETSAAASTTNPATAKNGMGDDEKSRNPAKAIPSKQAS